MSSLFVRVIFNRGLIAVSWDFFAERRVKETKREFLKISALNSDYFVDRGSGESDNERLTLLCFCHDLVVEKRDVGIIKYDRLIFNYSVHFRFCGYTQLRDHLVS